MSSSSVESSIRIGPYQIEERIGHGATGRVYRARAANGDLVAIKVLAPDASLHDPDANRRFQQEIRALEAVSHPNIVPILAHDEDPDFGAYFVTPLITGATLRARIDGTSICPEAALLIIATLADAVSALHANGFVHRDLKPENVMATADGRIQLVDLGLAFRPGQPRHTEHDVVVGSVPYMAPERIEGADVVGASDVWSVCVMAYECITGARPFARTTASEEAAAILVGAFAALPSVDLRVSEPLAEILASGLQRAGEQRPSAAQLTSRLRGLIDWCAPADIPAELASAVANPADYQRRVATFRVTSAKRIAARHINRGDGFAALRELNRGLAYEPRNPELLALCDTAETTLGASARPNSARRRLIYGASACVALLIGIVIAWRLAAPGSSEYGNTVRDTPSVIDSTGPLILTSDKASKAAKNEPSKKQLEIADKFLGIFEKGMGNKARVKKTDPKATTQDRQLDLTGRILDLLDKGMKAKPEKTAPDAAPAPR